MTPVTKKERLSRLRRELGLDKRRRARLLKFLKRFAAGRLTRAELQRRTGISWYGDVLAVLRLIAMPLPIVRTYNRYNKRQKALYNEIFSGAP